MTSQIDIICIPITFILLNNIKNNKKDIKMNNQKWQHICKVVNDAQKAAMHCSIATVDAQLQPTITPIGTLFLRENQSGFFFDTYTESLQQNLPQNSKACIQAVNSSRLFWLKSLFKGQFSDYPGVRLYVASVWPMQKNWLKFYDGFKF